ncbi:MAG: hypothetical protein HC882_01690 [Acidobacteria bacterium]|nr:hypothetical protein [Acidobacteriota bacterium]
MQRERGSGLVEFLVALSVLTICMMAATVYISTATHGTRHNTDKDFAIQKAISILEELKGVFESKTGNDATLLDGYDDGSTTSTVLTIQTGVTAPDHPSSGNFHDGSQWHYERQISVERFASVQSNDVRLVRVRIYGWVRGEKHPLAEVSSVIRTIADSYPPTQVYDIYTLAIENVPGWWVYMANLVPFVENAIADLQARNPGLEFRTHWIRKLAYGRDQQYVPFMNEATISTDDIDWVYYYPSSMPTTAAVNYYYVPSVMSARVSIDGTIENDYDATENTIPYALADQYNHAMRYGDEKALFDARVAAGLESADTPTWRLLIDDMYMHPENYENAILINVHGELFPFPPIRNFSDAAKDPENNPNIRVVTHPEYLRYDNDDAVNLRVYSYLTEPGDTTIPDQLAEPISVLIRDKASLTGIQVTAIEGGVDADGDGTLEPYTSETFDTFEDYTGDMYYTVTDVTDGVLIELFNSPVRTPCVGGASCPSGGIPTEKRLYAMDYIPTPLNLGVSTAAFSRNLTVSDNRTKNTARWIITIPDSDLTDDEILVVDTRLGNDLTTGVLFPTANEPANVSTTYVYRGDDTFIFGDGTAANPPNLPLTERFQVMGDPRHMPYADLKADYDATTNPLGEGYNRYFDDFHNSSGNRASDANYWPGFSAVRNDGTNNNDGWDSGSGYVDLEVNRCFEMLREALLRSHALYTTMTGFSYFYIGTGNEIGYDADNGFTNSIPVSTVPYTGASGSMNEMTITDAQNGGVRYVKSNDSTSTWWSMNWLGELYPDMEYATWASSGNLPAGSGANTYVRTRRDSITTRLPTGTTLQRTLRRLSEEGSTTFFSIGTSSSKFHHDYRDGDTGDLTDDGLDIAAHYNFPIPTTVDINRPFNVNRNSSGNVPTHYQDNIYYDGTLTGTVVTNFFDHESSGLIGSAMISHEGSLGDDHALVVVNGIAQTNLTGSAFMGRWAFLTLIQGYLAAGLLSDDIRIEQVPRVEMTAPNDATDLVDPSSIDIEWETTWRRWDGQAYTSNYADDFAESAAVSYVLLYSDDNGRSWKHMADDTAASPGRRPADSSLFETGASYTWSTDSTSFPEGTYLIRIDAFRDDKALHYAYHQRRIFIKR